MITPMTESTVDSAALEKMLDVQKKAGVSGVLLFGTTGEPLSLDAYEKTTIIETANRRCGKIPVICGISSPVTQVATETAKLYTKLGADAIMAITPYYYRCTDDGVFEHFKAVCGATDLPVVVYNVPARTGFDLSKKPELTEKICGLKNVCAVKNAISDRVESEKIILRTKKNVLCGDDENNLFCWQKGATGSISVVSDLLPELLVLQHKAHIANDEEKVEKAERALRTVYNVMAKVPNPIAIKYACAFRYGFAPAIRLPLTQPTRELGKEIEKVTLDALKITEELQ